MRETVIGRMLVASLHQAISELVPERLEFYESWLNSKRMRSSSITLGGMRAVVSFLRQESGMYDAVMGRAGDLTAEWTFGELSPLKRFWLRHLPRRVQARIACRFARRMAADTWEGTRAKVRWRRGRARLSLRTSLFCDVRIASPAALCHYYGAVARGYGRLMGVSLAVEAEQCQAQGEAYCVVVLTPDRGRRHADGAAAAALLVCLLTAGPLAAQTAQMAPTAPPAGARTSPPDRVLVMPFESQVRDPRLSWLREGAAVLLTDALRSAGAAAMTRDERLSAFERLQVPALASLSHATVVRLGELVGASEVMIGSIAADNETLVFSVRRLRLRLGRLEPPVVERARLADIFASIGRIGGALVPAVARAGGAAPAPAPPLAAFEAYIKGLQAGTPAAQVKLLHTALQAAPDFDPARIALWQVHTAAGEHRAALDAVRAVPDKSPVVVDARFLASVSHIKVGEFAEAYRLLTSLQQRAPSAIVQNNLGVLRLRAKNLPPDAAKAATCFQLARSLDPLDPDYVFNLGYTSWLDGDPQLASSWLREAVRLNPGDGAAHALLATVLEAAGQTAEAARELTLAQRLSSAYDALDLKVASGAPARGLERLKETIEPPRSERADIAVELIGQRDQRDMAVFYLDRGRRFFEQENDREAEPELKRALYLAPYDAEAHLLIGRICLRNGRVREAVEAFKISLWSQDTVAAHVALAEAYLEDRNPDLARSEAERALVIDPSSAAAQRVLSRLKR